MDKYRQAIIDLDREEPHDRPKDLELLNEAIEVLEIIKKKRVNIEYIKCCDTYEQYCLICSYANEITQEDYDKVKAWLENV